MIDIFRSEVKIGRVLEVTLDEQGRLGAWIDCREGPEPVPGQYYLGWAPEDHDAPLPAALFPAEIIPGRFRSAAPVPQQWLPGMELALRGPLGGGFRLPAEARRVALVALDAGAGRLMPLIDQCLANGIALALFTEGPLPPVPAAVEIYPLSGIAETLEWADLLAVDLPREALGGLRRALGLQPGTFPPCPVQVLIATPMPCGGLAECGACAVPARRSGWKLACKDGPVFDLNELEW